jgi:hypothetical protein
LHIPCEYFRGPKSDRLREIAFAVGLAIDPNTGSTDYNLFTLFWQGDGKSGGNGTAHELWFMSYQDDGWQSPTQIAGASPVTSPSACLTPSGVTLA